MSQTECRFFSYRLYNFTTSGSPDPTINVAFLAQLQALCPKNGDGLRRVALDKDSQAKFDVSFFKNVRDDQRLWADSSTQSVVQNYAGNVRGLLGLRFDFEFPKAMIKLSSIEVKTGTDGEIREVCSKFN
ncbi:Peroxidase 25 [Glycine soja]